jgi:hypothetical protein
MSRYQGWICTGRTWQAVAEGASLEAAYRALLARIRQLPRVPAASAVLPAGVPPDRGRER